MFENREDAAIQLAARLEKYKDKEGVVLAIPRGGVPIGCILAKSLGYPLDLVLSKKIGHPMNREFAIGFVNMYGEEINYTQNVSEKYIAEEVARIRKLLFDRYELYMNGRPPISFKNKIVIITDDGIATGSTILSSIDIVKREHPKKIVVAVPVGFPRIISKLKEEVDEVICLQTSDDFYAIGQFYEDFRQLDDNEVIELMETMDTNAIHYEGS